MVVGGINFPRTRRGAISFSRSIVKSLTLGFSFSITGGDSIQDVQAVDSTSPGPSTNDEREEEQSPSTNDEREEQSHLKINLCMNAKIQLLFHLGRSKPSMQITSSSMYGIIYLITCAEQVRTSSITLVKSQQNWSLRRLRIAVKKWRTCHPYNHEQGFCPKVKMVMSTTNDIYSFKKNN